MATYDTVNDENVVKIPTFPFNWTPDILLSRASYGVPVVMFLMQIPQNVHSTIVSSMECVLVFTVIRHIGHPLHTIYIYIYNIYITHIWEYTCYSTYTFLFPFYRPPIPESDPFQT